MGTEKETSNNDEYNNDKKGASYSEKHKSVKNLSQSLKEMDI